MSEFKFRTENIKPTKIFDYFVETGEDRKIIDRLKSETPVILVGSRGVGKSFLLRVAEAELQKEFNSGRILAVYISFTQGAVLQLKSENQFYQWMLARLCSAIIRKLKKVGLVTPCSALAQTMNDEGLSQLISIFENSWKTDVSNINLNCLPAIDDFKDEIEDICEEANINSINIYFDEAAHILRPAQQRQFFSLFRDINSPYLNCNAAVYPGVTSFGNYFQPIHDAVFIDLERDPTSEGYVKTMNEIVEKQADGKLISNIKRNMENFSVLAFAANGNPRLLLKTLSRAQSLSSRDINTVIREFYKNDIWEEHSLLSEKYSGFKSFIDWGRDFIEDHVLQEIKNKNEGYLIEDKKTTCFFWIHRETPEQVKKALSLLCYTGIISLHSEAMKATRGEIGTRYSVNFGCLMSLENNPTSTGLPIVKNITIKRMTEFGANHPAYSSLDSGLVDFSDGIIEDALQLQLDKPVDFLDIPSWLIDALKGLSLLKIRDVLEATEAKIQNAYYVGRVRSKYIKNEALSAVFEYLSG